MFQSVEDLPCRFGQGHVWPGLFQQTDGQLLVHRIVFGQQDVRVRLFAFPYREAEFRPDVFHGAHAQNR